MLNNEGVEVSKANLRRFSADPCAENYTISALFKFIAKAEPLTKVHRFSSQPITLEHLL